MKMLAYSLLSVFFVWIVWASISTGALYEFNKINSEYHHPDRDIAYLMKKYHYQEFVGMLDKMHVEKCAIYMPNWEKAKKCVQAGINCEKFSRDYKNYPRLFSYVMNSKEFDSCFEKNRPSLGLSEWLRMSRIYWRIGITYGAIWITGGYKNQSQLYWKKNITWINEMFEWVNKAV